MMKSGNDDDEDSDDRDDDRDDDDRNDKSRSIMELELESFSERGSSVDRLSCMRKMLEEEQMDNLQKCFE